MSRPMSRSGSCGMRSRPSPIGCRRMPSPSGRIRRMRGGGSRSASAPTAAGGSTPAWTSSVARRWLPRSHRCQRPGTTTRERPSSAAPTRWSISPTVGCGAPPGWTDAHHVIHWADGGPTDLDNLALLCRSCHTGVHHRDHQLTRHPDTGHWRVHRRHRPPPPTGTGPPEAAGSSPPTTPTTTATGSDPPPGRGIRHDTQRRDSDSRDDGDRHDEHNGDGRSGNGHDGRDGPTCADEPPHQLVLT
jgi:hypothetical protein